MTALLFTSQQVTKDESSGARHQNIASLIFTNTTEKQLANNMNHIFSKCSLRL